MSGQTWTPAPKRGVIPLHPMTFGMLLGRAFSALRHNPKVLFGFAVAVQLGVTFATVAVMVLVLGLTFGRLSTVPAGSPDYGPILAGTIAINVIAGVVLALASIAFTAVVQGLVAADVSFAAIGRKAPLRLLWSRVRPAFWRLWAFALLQAFAVIAGLALLAGVVLGVLAGTGFEAAGVGVSVLLGILLILAGIPLFVWLATKLLLVPSALVLERATLRTALVRSWRLTRGRFWVALGVMFLIGAVMGLAAQVVSIPGTIITSVLSGIIAPTGSEDPSAIIGLIAATVLPQVLVLAVQAITLVVQGTGATLIYLDSRMRYEGLDQTLIAFVERSALGTSDDDLGDPYAVDASRAVSRTPPPRPAPGYPAGFAQPGTYPAPAAYPASYGAPQPGYPQPDQQYPPQAYAQPDYPPPPAPGGHHPGPPAPAPPAPAPPAPVAPTSQQTDSPPAPSPWAPPGGSA